MHNITNDYAFSAQQLGEEVVPPRAEQLRHRGVRGQQESGNEF